MIFLLSIIFYVSAGIGMIICIGMIGLLLLVLLNDIVYRLFNRSNKVLTDIGLYINRTHLRDLPKRNKI